MPQLEPSGSHVYSRPFVKRMETKKPRQLQLPGLLRKKIEPVYLATRVTLNSVRRLRWYSSSDLGLAMMGRVSP